jgi:nucleoside-diphosphate kinase
MRRTLAILKPDCVKGRHCAEVIRMIMDDGFKVVAAKAVRLDENILREHYAHHAQKPFFPSLVAFMSRTPVLLLLLEREGAIAELRRLCGPTDSNEARKTAPDSIRAKFGKDKSENVIHASDGPDTAQAEEKRFFSAKELTMVNKNGMSSEELMRVVKTLYG